MNETQLNLGGELFPNNEDAREMLVDRDGADWIVLNVMQKCEAVGRFCLQTVAQAVEAFSLAEMLVVTVRVRTTVAKAA